MMRGLWRTAIWQSLKDVLALLGFFWFSGEAARQAFGHVPYWVLVSAQLATFVVAQRFFTGKWYWWRAIRPRPASPSTSEERG